MATNATATEDRLEKLAASLRQQGLIQLGERDLMVEAAQLIRDLREEAQGRIEALETDNAGLRGMLAQLEREEQS